MQTVHGVAKPVYRAFQLLHGAGDRFHSATVQSPTPFVSSWATTNSNNTNGANLQNLNIFVSNFRRQNDSEPMPTPAAGYSTSIRVIVQLRASDDVPATVQLILIDSQNSNPRSLWERFVDFIVCSCLLFSALFI